jgi:hypothetical protein
MKILSVEQGSQEWLDARIGVLTASSLDRVMTPKKREPSSQMAKLAHEMLAEVILGQPLASASTGFMERGKDLEGEARAWYEMETDGDVERVGFITREDGRVGCSPDGLVGDVGGLEIKCPSAGTHVAYLLGGPGEDYVCQVQGCLWITGRAWWDFVSYCPGFPPYLQRFTRDEAFIASLSKCVDQFLALYDQYWAKLGNMGLVRGTTMSDAQAMVRAA